MNLFEYERAFFLPRGILMVLYHGETSLLVIAYCRICGVGFFLAFFLGGGGD